MITMTTTVVLAAEDLPSSTTTRVVVTFRSAVYNTLEAAELVPDDITVVKQYGRRLVLHLGENGTIDNALWIAGIWGGDSLVERVEPDWLVGVGDDNNNNSMEEEEEVTQSSALPWHLDPSEPFGLHLGPSLTKRNISSVVALLDSGLASVASGLWTPVSGFCFISSPDYTNTNLGRNPDFTDPGDQGPACPSPSWHGTKVASIIKAVAPNARLSILRVLGQCGKGFASDVTDAIVWAAGGWISGVKPNLFPAKVVSMSLAGKGPCPTYMQSGVNQAISLGATVIAAAGNAGANATLYFPGNCKGVLSIGASTRQGTLAAYSNWGETLAFSAPGGDAVNPVQVLGVGPDDSQQQQLSPTTASGTSFATPHVASVVALLQAVNASLDQGGKYVPCVGGCGVKGILNGVDQAEESRTTTNNNRSDLIVHISSSGQWCSSTACYQCSPGSYPTGSTCTKCTKGKYGLEEWGQQTESECKLCPPGKYSFDDGYVSCTQCYYGKKAETYGQTTCLSCSVGTYNDLLGNSACNPCPAGQYCSSQGCVTCPLCSAGTFWVGTGANSATLCLSCGVGKFSAAPGASNSGMCGDCPLGTYNSATGMSVCTLCFPGSYNYAYGGQSSAACTACGSGFYSTASGQHYQGSCLECSAGYYTSVKMSSACSACEAGKFSTPGKTGACMECTLKANFNTGQGMTTCYQCSVVNCPSGQTLQSCIATADGSCTNCTLYPNCDYRNAVGCFRDDRITPGCSCAPGFQMDNSAIKNKCVQCPSGTWKGIQNHDPCIPWTNATHCTPGQVYLQGTRTHDSGCVDFSATAPDHAVTVPQLGGVEWVCDNGYERLFRITRFFQKVLCSCFMDNWCRPLDNRC